MRLKTAFVGVLNATSSSLKYATGLGCRSTLLSGHRDLPRLNFHLPFSARRWAPQRQLPRLQGEARGDNAQGDDQLDHLVSPAVMMG